MAVHNMQHEACTCAVTGRGVCVQTLRRECKFRGNCLLGCWPLQQKHPYLKVMLIYGGVLTSGEIHYVVLLFIMFYDCVVKDCHEEVINQVAD